MRTTTKAKVSKVVSLLLACFLALGTLTNIAAATGLNDSCLSEDDIHVSDVNDEIPYYNDEDCNADGAPSSIPEKDEDAECRDSVSEDEYCECEEKDKEEEPAPPYHDEKFSDEELPDEELPDEKLSDEELPDEDIVNDPDFGPLSGTVKFDLQGGYIGDSSYYITTVSAGQLLGDILPDEPVREHFNFAGWAAGPNGNVIDPWTFEFDSSMFTSTPVFDTHEFDLFMFDPFGLVEETGDITFYAIWHMQIAAANSVSLSGTLGTVPWRRYQDGLLVFEEGSFEGTTAIAPWNASAITRIRFDGPVTARADSSRFFGNHSSLTRIDNIHHLDTSNVTNMSQMFAGSRALTSLNLNSWDTSKVTDMSQMFLGVDDWNWATGNRSALSSLSINNWDTSNVTNMSQMFLRQTSLINLNLNSWDTGKVTDMSGMFNSASALRTLSAGDWNTGSVKNMSGMFANASVLNNLNVSNWNTGSVENMSDMFANANVLNLDVSNWDTSSVTDMAAMFFNPSAIGFLDVSNWDTSRVTNMANMFSGVWTAPNMNTGMAINVTNVNIDVSRWDTRKVTDMSGMFERTGGTVLGLSNWDTRGVTNMRSMFAYSSFSSETGSTLNLSGWDTRKVTSMSWMFPFSRFTGMDLSNWNIGKVTDMSMMFSSARYLTTLDLSNWDTTNTEANMSNMFSNAIALTALDLGNWDTSGVTNMHMMFSGAASLASLDLRNWDTSNVTAKLTMFHGTQSMKALSLGENWQPTPISFTWNPNALSTFLPGIPATASYTGFWTNVGNGTTANPQGNLPPVTSNELMRDFDGAVMADTWVWQRTAREVHFVAGANGTLVGTTPIAVHGESIGMAAIPSPVGITDYGFLHWTSNRHTGTFSTAQIRGLPITSETTFTAHFRELKRIPYVDIAKDTDGEFAVTLPTRPDPDNVEFHEENDYVTIIITPPPAYYFDPDNLPYVTLPPGYEQEGELEVDKDGRLVVVIRPIYVRYTYDWNIPGVTSIVSNLIRYNTTPPIPPYTPSRPGYTHTGWDRQVNIPIKEDTTFTAQWAPIPFTPPDDNNSDKDNGGDGNNDNNGGGSGNDNNDNNSGGGDNGNNDNSGGGSDNSNNDDGDNDNDGNSNGTSGGSAAPPAPPMPPADENDNDNDNESQNDNDINNDNDADNDNDGSSNNNGNNGGGDSGATANPAPDTNEGPGADSGTDRGETATTPDITLPPNLTPNEAAAMLLDLGVPLGAYAGTTDDGMMIFDLDVPLGPFTHIGVTPEGEVMWMTIDNAAVPLAALADQRSNPQTGDTAMPFGTPAMQLLGLFLIIAAFAALRRRKAS